MKDFIFEFNSNLPETLDMFLGLNGLDNGFSKGIIFPEIHLWDNENYSEKYVVETSLSTLTVNLKAVLKIAERMLLYKIDEFFEEVSVEFKDKFDLGKMRYRFISNNTWELSVSGKYNEDIMGDFLDTKKEDFEYIFRGLKLDLDY